MPTLQLPCKVCEDPSTGVHYGVLSCDACKGFFGRQLKSRGRHIVCPYNKTCKISKISRKHVCAPCRFSKCLQVGMSKEAIRTGRYTQQLKQSFQSEIRQFERRKSQQQTQGCHTDIRQHQLDHRPGLQHKDGFQETAETQQFERRHTRQQPLDTPPTHTELAIDPFVDISCTSCSADDYDDNDCDCDGDDDDEDDDTEYDTNYGNQHIISMDSSRLEASSRVGPNGESVEEIIHTIVHAYHILPSNIKSSQDYLDKMAREYLEQYQLKEKLFGKMSAVSAQEFTEIFSMTGIDVDDRLHFTDAYLNSIRGWLRKLVHFSRRIPGFRALPLQDQFNLLKYNNREFRFIGAYKGFNCKLRVAVNPNGFRFHEEEMGKVHPLGISRIIFDVARNLQRTRLTTEEHIIVQAMSLFFPDRAPLSDRPAVEAMQTMLLSCLEFLTRQRPTPRDRVRGLTQAMDMLTTIRGLSVVEDRNTEQKGWLGQLKRIRMTFLEEEMENISHNREFLHQSMIPMAIS